MLSSDEGIALRSPRNLSKDYLAGTIPFDYVPSSNKNGSTHKTTSRSRLGRPVRELDVVKLPKPSSPVK